MTVPDESLAAQVARLVAMEEIRQLAYRYALAVDSRDLDSLVALFIEDVQVGRDQRGRPALRAYFDRILRGFTTSIHFVGNHLIELDDTETAHGIVTCRAEHESDAHWVIELLQYHDQYARRDGRWLFVRRRVRPWLAVDMLERPVGPHKMRWPGRPVAEGDLPGLWPTWAAFWQAEGG